MSLNIFPCILPTLNKKFSSFSDDLFFSNPTILTATSLNSAPGNHVRMNSDSSVIHARVVAIGDSFVGKTSLVSRVMEDRFDPNQKQTIGADWQLYVQSVNNDRVELQIWDTAGQEKFRSLGPLYYRSAAGAILVFDVTNRSSFEHLNSWIDAFMETAGTQVSIVVAANKSDRESDREVTQKESQDWANAKGFVVYQTSAKTGQNVAALFRALAESVGMNKLAQNDPRKTALSGQTQSSCC
jgi:small GTP-binding protein